MDRQPGDTFSSLDPSRISTSSEEDDLQPLELDKVCPTDYGKFVLDALASMAKPKQDDESDDVPSSSSAAPSSSIDQDVLRQCIRLSSSFLLTDSTMNAETGVQTWFTGMNRVVDIILALDRKDVLEVATMTEVSKACTECWVAAGAFPGIADCRTHVRDFGIKLKRLLDPGNNSYKGQRLFAK